jgi:hypothetical protein
MAVPTNAPIIIAAKGLHQMAQLPPKYVLARWIPRPAMAPRPVPVNIFILLSFH